MKKKLYRNIALGDGLRALYAKFLGVYVADAFSRYTTGALWLRGAMPSAGVRLQDEMLLVGVKSMYGWACYACVALVMGFFLFDSPIRRHRSYMLPWRVVGEAIRKY